MKQITQKLGNGEMKVQEVPTPIPQKGMILVRNHYSIISAGTESSTVSSARKSLIGKAKERPQQVKQVLESLRKSGPVHTYRAVSKKLDGYSPLGYSCSGEIIGLGEGVETFKVGDYVACGGIGHANHAEIVSVPTNLAVRLQDNVNLLQAAYNTIGAIALQSVRISEVKIGETVAVIGLGLVGQITAMILKSAGVEVIGIDVSEEAVEFAKNNKSSDHVFKRSQPGLNGKILDLTSSQGVDSCIITAGTNSLDPINFAGEISRKKGVIVVCGAIPTGFERNPHWYPKELELRMSCSYGPGRYDLSYEEKGLDYPYAYVRWTQNRNMQAFQNLIHKEKFNLDAITTHQFDFKNATDAYGLIMAKEEFFLGVALKYDISKKIESSKIEITNSNNSKLSLS